MACQDQTAKTGSQELVQESQDHQDRMPSCTTAFCLCLLSAHARPPLVCLVRQDHQDRTEILANQEATETMVHLVHKAQQAHQDPLASPANPDNADHLESPDSLCLVDQPLLVPLVLLEDLDLLDSLERRDHQDEMAKTDHLETPESLVSEDHQDHLDQAAARELQERTGRLEAATTALLLASRLAIENISHNKEPFACCARRDFLDFGFSSCSFQQASSH